MKKCKNCKINDARYICLGYNREFCTYCMKEEEFFFVINVDIISNIKINNNDSKKMKSNQEKIILRELILLI